MAHGQPGQSTELQALIAAMLGDIGKLHHSVEQLPGRLSPQLDRVTEQVDRTAKVIDDAEEVARQLAATRPLSPKIPASIVGSAAVAAVACLLMMVPFYLTLSRIDGPVDQVRQSMARSLQDADRCRSVGGQPGDVAAGHEAGPNGGAYCLLIYPSPFPRAPEPPAPARPAR